VFEAFEAVAHDLSKHIPDDDGGVVAITFDHFRGFIFDSLLGVWSDLGPVVHAFDGERAHKQDTHFVCEIIYDWRLGFAPRADHVDVTVFDKLKFFF